MNDHHFTQFKEEMAEFLQKAEEHQKEIRSVHISLVYKKGNGNMLYGFSMGELDTFKIIMVNILQNIASTENIPEATVLSEVLNLSAEITKMKEKEHHERSI